MPWWGWIMVGAALLGSELLVVDAEFYLVFLGISAVLVGLADLAGFDGPVWVEWLSFAAISVAAMVTFRGRLYDRLRGGSAGLEAELLGETAVVEEAIAPGETGRASLRGSVWTARNQGDVALDVGARVHVEGAEGLVLLVRPADPA